MDSYPLPLEWSRSEYVFFVDEKETWEPVLEVFQKVPAWIVISGEISTEVGQLVITGRINWDAQEFPDYYFNRLCKVYKKAEVRIYSFW